VKLAITRSLASALKKSPRSIATYCVQFRHYFICEMEMAVNQHDRTRFCICDGFWPYIRDTSQSPADDVAIYAEQIHSLMGKRACVKCSFSAPDRGVAAKFSRRTFRLFKSSGECAGVFAQIR